MRAVPHLCELYPDICLTTEEKARKNLNQGSRRIPVSTMKTEYTEQSIHNNKNTLRKDSAGSADFLQTAKDANITLHYITLHLNTGSEQTRPNAGMCKESPGRSNLLEKRYNETLLYTILHSQTATMSCNMATNRREK